ncbi:MAG TPA: phosphoribosyltransferase family protein, partial [Dehalococcoidia bacterium]|nr:phosphoribosyltransferase family protein [Dehalococcoidia bacterium]
MRSRGAATAASNSTSGPAASDPSPAPATQPASEPGTRPRRYRGARGGRRHRHPETPPIPAEVAEEVRPPAPEPAIAEGESKPTRRRGSRGGRKHKKPALKAAATAPAAAFAEPPAITEKRRPARKPTQRIASQPAPTPARAPTRAQREAPAARPRPVAARKQKAPQRAVAVRKQKIPVTGAPTENVPAPFAHNAEYEFARILDFYGIDWQYEPRTFPLRWERGHVSEAFTPDFFLTDLNLYVELTTLKSGLTAEKNRKMRLIKEMYPGTNIIMLKKHDYLRLLAKYGYGTLSPDEAPDIDRVLIPTAKLQKRVAELGAQISREYAGREPVLVGVLRGVMCFIADLMREITVPTAVDFMAISSYEGNGASAVRIHKDLDENIKGRDVILVEDIV